MRNIKPPQKFINHKFLYNDMRFTEAKQKFDNEFDKSLTLDKSLVPSNGKYLKNISLKNKAGEPSEEYYKWQFVSSLINSGLYSKDFIGVELHFPKGNKNSAPIKIDGGIFDDESWIEYYKKWTEKKDEDSLHWLRKHLIAIIEFKKSDGKDIRTVFSSQIRAYMNEPDIPYCLGLYYDFERLHIFQRKGKAIIRYDESKNEKGNLSGTNDLSLELTDGYNTIPSFEELINRVNKPSEIDRSKRTVGDLDLISGVHSSQINSALSNILIKMDRVGMVNQRGYEILIQLLALKIFDEKRSQSFDSNLKFYETEQERKRLNLLFYINPEEKDYGGLSDEAVQSFIERIRKLYNDASIDYKVLLKNTDDETITWKNESHVKVISSIVDNLQDYSFINSSRTDLYQRVFNKFASAFTKVEKSQFVTPLKLIDFLVKIVNPKTGEKIIDPTVGIADFLSMSYMHSKMNLDDRDIYGADNDDQMIMLAKLNMLLNGDGNATLKYKPDLGSLLYKFDTNKELIPLKYPRNKGGDWDNWADQTKLMKFDVVLTNPPFGDNRKFEPNTKKEKEVAELYEMWDIARHGNSIDMGILFLENAYRILDDGGRMGIVLSNSIATIPRWEKAREWLLNNMRIVATFDLPANTFADTGVNTTLIVAYKPKKKELEKLKEQDYEIFVRDIINVGYKVRTTKRLKKYVPIYKIDENTLEIAIDDNGNPLLKEDFTKTVNEFKDWINSQEKKLKDAFS